MIIVTGVDNTGKSSLARHLSKEFGIAIAQRYHTLPPTDGWEWYIWAKHQFEHKGELIYDRFFIDELVYGPVLRDKYVVSIEQMAQLSTMLVMRQPLFIYTKLPLEKIQEGFEVREQYPDATDLGKLLNKFERVMHTWPVKELKNCTRFCYLNDPNYRRIDLVVKNYLQGGTI